MVNTDDAVRSYIFDKVSNLFSILVNCLCCCLSFYLFISNTNFFVLFVCLLACFCLVGLVVKFVLQAYHLGEERELGGAGVGQERAVAVRVRVHATGAACPCREQRGDGARAPRHVAVGPARGRG